MSETKAKHTPGDWRKGQTYSTHNHPERYWQTTVLSESGAVTYACGATQEEAEANAARIVLCCNAHNGLVDALEAITFAAKLEGASTARGWAELLASCDEALAAAKEKP